MNALISKGKSRNALDQAKEIHSRHKCAASESLLMDAYAARAQSLLARDMNIEVRSLIDMIGSRYAGSYRRFDEMRLLVSFRLDGIKGAVAPLNDPGLASVKRAAIEDLIRRELVDLRDLAECPSLAEDHPLRKGASALAAAFDAVTAGPVGEQSLDLPEVSRRSPLGPWKALVRAIGSLYRNDDAACLSYIGAIESGSAPSRLIPALHSILEGRLRPELAAPRQTELALQVSGSRETFRASLESIDKAFATGSRTGVCAAIPNALQACRQYNPQFLERLQQHLAVRILLAGLSPSAVPSVANALRDAHFWRMYASALERRPEVDSLFQACSAWEEFRRHAIAQGWFQAGSVAEAALYLHMAETLSDRSWQECESVRRGWFHTFEGYDGLYAKQPPEIRNLASRIAPDLYFLSPRELYARACRMDPHAFAFQRWTEWEKRLGGNQANDAAEAWHRALPGDIAPLLHLMEAAERRGALNKALANLEKAESLDGLNIEVRRARMRLLVSTAIRHLKQRKARLAGKDLAEIAPLPQAQQGDRPAFMAALAWVSSRLEGAEDKAAMRRAEISRVLEDGCAEAMVLWNVARICEYKEGVPQRDSPSAYRAEAAGVARACALGDDMGLEMEIPREWADDLTKRLTGKSAQVDPSHLSSLAEAALRRKDLRLAYAATTQGLAGGSAGGPGEARFLFLRARSLPATDGERRNECLAAAAEMARQRRDMDLLNEVIELRRSVSRSLFGGLRMPGEQFSEGDLSMTAGQLKEVLGREKAAIDYKPSPMRFPAGRPSRECNCAACRAERAGGGSERGMPTPGDFREIDEMLAGLSPEQKIELLMGFAQEMGLEPPRRGRKKGRKTGDFDFPF